MGTDYVLDHVEINYIGGHDTSGVSSPNNMIATIMPSGGGTFTQSYLGGFPNTTGVVSLSFSGSPIGQFVQLDFIQGLIFPDDAFVFLGEIQFFGSAPVPEPSSFLLLGLGALGLVRHTHRSRRRA